MSKYLFVAISDAHLNEINVQERDYHQKLESLIKTIKFYYNEFTSNEVVLVLNGDLIDKGEVENFDLVYLFIETIKDKLRGFKIEVSVILVPGNHDNDFDRSEDILCEIESIRKKIINRAENIDYTKLIEEDTTLSEFIKLNDEYKNAHLIEENLFFREYLYKNNGKNLKFLAFNSTVFCDSSDAQGKVCIDCNFLKNRLSFDENEVVVSASHYPLDWFDRDAPDSIDFIKAKSDIIFFAHEHRGDFAEYNSDTKTIYINLPRFNSEKAKNDSGITLASIDLDGNRIEVIEFIFNGEAYVLDNESKTKIFEIKKYITKSNGLVSFESAKISYMNEIGTYFENKKKLKLEDIFVEPQLFYNDFQDGEDGEIIERNINLSEFVISSDLTIINGERSSGKTTLLYTMFMTMFTNKKIPIIVDGYDIAKRLKGDKAFDYILKKLNELYEENIEILKQNSSDIVVLIDNIHNIKQVKRLNPILQKLKMHNITMVATSSISFGMTRKISKDINDDISVSTYDIKPFTNTQLYIIVEKWHSFDRDLDKDELHSLVYKSKSIIAKVSTNRMVQLNPMFVILLLEANDENYINTLVEASNIVYYEYLINKAIIQVSHTSKIDTQTIREFLQYLAYYLITYEDFDYMRFKENYIELFPIDESDFVKLYDELKVFLKNKNILLGDFLTELRFNHDFVFYYYAASFLGKYTNKFKDQINSMIDELNVENYANTISFLVQFSQDNFIFDSIINTTNSLFKDDIEIQGNEDIDLLNKLIINVEKIEKYGDIKTNNIKLNQEIDRNYEKSKKLTNEEKEKLREMRNSEMGINISKGLKLIQINGEILKQSLLKENKVKITETNLRLVLRMIGNFTESFKKQLVISFSDKGELEDKELIPEGLNIFVLLFILGAQNLGGENNNYCLNQVINEDVDSQKLIRFLYNITSRKNEDDRFNTLEIRDMVNCFDEQKNYIMKAIIYFMLEFHLNFVGISASKIIELSKFIHISEKNRAKMLKKSFEDKY
jgi:3',5'-cyclic AMP phosphodiesterase CpdA